MLDDIASLLVAGGVGTLGTDIFLGYIPKDNPTTTSGACCMLFEYGGNPPELLLSDVGDEYAGLQVRTRANRDHYKDGKAFAKHVELHLHGVSNTTINGKVYKLITAQQSIAFLDRDEQSRPEWVQNYIVMKDL
jgi:hypothetical protein